MKKRLMLPIFLSFLLVGCGTGSSSHPLVGNKFNLSSDDPTATYETGYDTTSYFALISTASDKNFSTFSAFDTRVRSFFSEGFIKISDTEYNGGYFSYGTTSETSILATLYPNDDKGIDSEKMRPIAESHDFYISFGSYDDTSFEFIFSSFEKSDSSYSAVITSNYYPDKKDETVKNVATFAYHFTKA